MATKNLPESSGNELIRRIEGSEYIKNPLVYAQMRGNLSLLQTNVYVAIVAALQDRINKYYERQSNGGQQLTLFDDDNNGTLKLTIPLSTLGIRSKYYKEIEEAVDKMQNVKYKLRRKVDGAWVYESHVLLPVIKIPDTTYETGFVRKKGVIELTMMTETAKFFFDMNTGYVTHLKNIVSLCKNSKTPRLYIYLSYLNSKQYKGVGEVPYNDLKEFLGALEYADVNRTEIKKDRYKAYSYFTRDVLEPVKTELDALADSGQVEFSFTYEPVYNNPAKKRGNPDELRFILRKGKSRKQIAEEKLATEQVARAAEEREKSKDGVNRYVTILREIYNGNPEAVSEWQRENRGKGVPVPTPEECVSQARRMGFDITK